MLQLTVAAEMLCAAGGTHGRWRCDVHRSFNPVLYYVSRLCDHRVRPWLPTAAGLPVQKEADALKLASPPLSFGVVADTTDEQAAALRAGLGQVEGRRGVGCWRPQAGVPRSAGPPFCGAQLWALLQGWLPHPAPQLQQFNV